MRFNWLYNHKYYIAILNFNKLDISSVIQKLKYIKRGIVIKQFDNSNDFLDAINIGMVKRPFYAAIVCKKELPLKILLKYISPDMKIIMDDNIDNIYKETVNVLT